MTLVRHPVPGMRLAICAILFFVVAVVTGPSHRIAPERVEAARGFPVYATVATKDALKVRSKPGGKNVVTKLAPGTKVEVLAGPDADGWYKIDAVDKPHARRGWVRGKSISIDQYVRATWDLNLFAGPSEVD